MLSTANLSVRGDGQFSLTSIDDASSVINRLPGTSHFIPSSTVLLTLPHSWCVERSVLEGVVLTLLHKLWCVERSMLEEVVLTLLHSWRVGRSVLEEVVLTLSLIHI